MSEQRKARLAFLGCGGFCTASILPGVARSELIDVVAICDLNQQAAEDRARRFGALRTYTDYNEMIDKEELDGVFVIGAAPQQYKLAPEVMKRGLPVYVEKPSANTSYEAVEMAQIAEENGVWGQVGFMKHFCDPYVMAKEIMAKEDFGDPLVVNAKFSQGPYPQIWGIDSARRSFLIGQCVHILDLIRFFGGDVKSVHTAYVEKTPEQFAYLVNVNYANGAVGQVNLNGLESKKGFSDLQERLEVVGDDQIITVDDMLSVSWRAKDEWLEGTTRRGRFVQRWEPATMSMPDSYSHNGYMPEAEHFALRCIGEVDHGPDLWDSAKALAIGEAVYESAQSGMPVAVRKI